jgi:YfiH family protein
VWSGWLRVPAADGHLAFERPTAMAVSLADCVPVFIGHRRCAGVLHAGWRGTAGNIAAAAIGRIASHGVKPAELLAHLGPAICGRCYQVGPEVLAKLTGEEADGPHAVDLRALIARQLEACGVRQITISQWCTRCHNDRFFSHRAGDDGRQVGVIVSASVP